MAERLTITGQKEFCDAIQKVGEKTVTTILPKVCRAMTKPIVADARKRVSPIKQSGALRKSIKAKVKTYRSGITVAVIGPDTTTEGIYKGKLVRPKNTAHLVDLGTKRHFQPKRRIQHPGAKPRPFLRVAFNTNRDTALAIGQKTFKSEVDKAARKAA